MNNTMQQGTRIIVAAAMSVGLVAAALYAQNAPRGTPPEYSDADGYAVLSALLEREHHPKGQPLLVNSVTSSGLAPDSFQSCGKIPRDFLSAAHDFSDNNRTNWRLLKKFKLSFEYRFADEVGKPADQNPGQQEPAPAGEFAYTVSAVGFDAAHSHAIAYLAGGAGSEASGGYYLLVKTKYGWGLAKGVPLCQWMTRNLRNPTGRRSS